MMLFGKDGPGTQGEHAMDAVSHYTLTASDTPDSACRMEWGELKVEAAGDWRRPTDEPPEHANRFQAQLESPNARSHTSPHEVMP